MEEEDYFFAEEEAEEDVYVESDKRKGLEPLRIAEIRTIMEQEIKFGLNNQTYSQEKAPEIAKIVSNNVLTRIQDFGAPNWKYLTNSIILPKNQTDIDCYSVNLWDDDDDYIVVSQTNDTIRYTMTLWGISCEI
ncbi:hypothetical protein TVAG_492240 [Trichomonas vaginalis G3]|uniref:Tctex-1 family protein n=1 Tax=Trichomonas vaginalis (strain ATCC PRA-98 / G3) TaxID=412133 RepID=A2G582_TRIV3|nr:dynein light chain tctex-type family [Trichomonas vaginalis G3]EAX87683.1 hypothetical protein TVAG_492240 [Trichomonas vaginalis G3]KAI5545109.1 dynein light chain tctex-type family [Trichomonas vaginalis G3]|eukprot:XP_001300613.1 hypothetical protein [Trichomonas vaginalis G3]